MRTMTDEERAAARARVQYLLPGVTDAGLRYVLEHAEAAARIWPRDLSSGTLAAEQATRHGLLADADEVLSKARRERTHGASCDCGACTAPTASLADVRAAEHAAEMHDTASDAAAVIGATTPPMAHDPGPLHRARPRVGGWSDPIIEGIRASERGLE